MNALADQKLNGQQVARAGEYLVAAQVHLRGGYAVTFAGNMPGIDLIASGIGHTQDDHSGENQDLGNLARQYPPGCPRMEVRHDRLPYPRRLR